MLKIVGGLKPDKHAKGWVYLLKTTRYIQKAERQLKKGFGFTHRFFVSIGERYTFQHGHREAGRAAALSRGAWYAIAVVFFLEGATEKLPGRRLLVEESGIYAVGRLLRRGHRELGRAAALSRGAWYAVVFFLEGATETLAGRRLLVEESGRLSGVFLEGATEKLAGRRLLVEGSGCEGSSELELGRQLVVA